jgi:hypothetical protein
VPTILLRVVIGGHGASAPLHCDEPRVDGRWIDIWDAGHNVHELRPRDLAWVLRASGGRLPA